MAQQINPGLPGEPDGSIIYSQSQRRRPSVSMHEFDDQLLQIIYPETILEEKKNLLKL